MAQYIQKEIDTRFGIQLTAHFVRSLQLLQFSDDNVKLNAVVESYPLPDHIVLNEEGTVAPLQTTTVAITNYNPNAQSSALEQALSFLVTQETPFEGGVVTNLGEE